jgi:N-formylglutamate amidohydrolase
MDAAVAIPKPSNLTAEEAATIGVGVLVSDHGRVNVLWRVRELNAQYRRLLWESFTACMLKFLTRSGQSRPPRISRAKRPLSAVVRALSGDLLSRLVMGFECGVYAAKSLTSLGIQLLKASGFRVIASCSQDNIDVCPPGLIFCWPLTDVSSLV